MGLAELTSRLRGWLIGEYQAVIFEEVDDIVAYALYKEESDRIHLRQFFVQRDKRRSGRGRQCIGLLRSEVWPSNKRVTVDVLCHNKEGTKFWRAVGFSEYCLTLEILPESIHSARDGLK